MWAVAIAASAGGIPAIDTVLSELPPSLPAVFLVVQHMERTRSTTELDAIFGRHTRLKVTEACADDRLEPGHVYVARPDRHMIVTQTGRIGLTETAPVHFVRPAADVLFATVAERFGQHAIGVVLSGSGHDGAEGAADIRRAGGIVIAQDEASSQYFSMPKSVIDLGQATYVLPLNRISQKLIGLIDANGGN